MDRFDFCKGDIQDNKKYVFITQRVMGGGTVFYSRSTGVYFSLSNSGAWKLYGAYCLLPKTIATVSFREPLPL
jgi:hypothetical protein